MELTSTVIATTTGPLGRESKIWLGVLHGGAHALVGELTAAEVLGMRNWFRDEITIVVPHGSDVGEGYPGIRFRSSRRSLAAQRKPSHVLPTSRIEPAVLLFAARQTSTRTADGVLAAVVQQRLTSPDLLLEWVDRLRPLKRASRFRSVLREIGGGAHSASELDVNRLCKRFGLVRPVRQVRRRDAAGRLRFTDCEWRLRDGRTLVLEIDGAFHMEVEHWEDDIARQRALTTPTRIVVRCTSRELRDEPESVFRDLRLLGVPELAG